MHCQFSIPAPVSEQDTEQEVQDTNAELQRSQKTCLVPFGSFEVCAAPEGSIQPSSLYISQFTQIKTFPGTQLALTAVNSFRSIP